MPKISAPAKPTLKPGQLGIYEFAEHLLNSGDLDPVYVVLYEGNLPGAQLHRWLVGYWCFYSVGVASWLSEFKEHDFFRQLVAAVPGTEHPRGHERRHFRGKGGLSSATYLGERAQQLGGCSALVRSLWEADNPVTLHTVSARAQVWKGFGPWISFKIADMLERLGLCAVKFEPSDIFHMFDSPREGAELMAAYYDGPRVTDESSSDDACGWAYDELIRALGTYAAPPANDRRINIQEVETILCKWKSHLNGHYPPGNDVHEVRESLVRYGTCRTSQRLLQAGLSAGLWN